MKYLYKNTIVIVITVIIVGHSQAQTPGPDSYFSYEENNSHLKAGSLHFHFQGINWLDWLAQSAATAFILPTALSIPGHLSLIGNNHNIGFLKTTGEVLYHLIPEFLSYGAACQTFSTLDKVKTDLTYLAKASWSGVETTTEKRTLLNYSTNLTKPPLLQIETLKITKNPEGEYHIYVPEHLYHPQSLMMLTQWLEIPESEKMPAQCFFSHLTKAMKFITNAYKSSYSPLSSAGQKFAGWLGAQHLSYSLNIPRTQSTVWRTPSGFDIVLPPNASPSETIHTTGLLIPDSSANKYPHVLEWKKPAYLSFFHEGASKTPVMSSDNDSGRNKGNHHVNRQSSKNSQKSAKNPRASNQRRSTYSPSGSGGNQPPRKPSGYDKKLPADKPDWQKNEKATESFSQEREERKFGHLGTKAREQYLKGLQPIINHNELTIVQVASDHNCIASAIGIQATIPALSQEEVRTDLASDSASIKLTAPESLLAGLLTEDEIKVIQTEGAWLDARVAGLLAARKYNKDVVHIYPNPADHNPSVEVFRPDMTVEKTFQPSSNAIYLIHNGYGHYNGALYEPSATQEVTEFDCAPMTAEKTYTVVPLDEKSTASSGILANLARINPTDAQPQIIVYGSQAQRAHMFRLYSVDGSIIPRDWDFKILRSSILPILKVFGITTVKEEELETLFSHSEKIQVERFGTEHQLRVNFKSSRKENTSYQSFTITLYHEKMNKQGFYPQLSLDFTVMESLPEATTVEFERVGLLPVLSVENILTHAETMISTEHSSSDKFYPKLKAWERLETTHNKMNEGNRRRLNALFPKFISYMESIRRPAFKREALQNVPAPVIPAEAVTYRLQVPPHHHRADGKVSAIPPLKTKLPEATTKEVTHQNSLTDRQPSPLQASDSMEVSKMHASDSSLQQKQRSLPTDGHEQAITVPPNDEVSYRAQNSEASAESSQTKDSGNQMSPSLSLAQPKAGPLPPETSADENRNSEESLSKEQKKKLKKERQRLRKLAERETSEAQLKKSASQQSDKPTPKKTSSVDSGVDSGATKVTRKRGEKTKKKAHDNLHGLPTVTSIFDIQLTPDETTPLGHASISANPLHQRSKGQFSEREVDFEHLLKQLEIQRRLEDGSMTLFVEKQNILRRQEQTQKLSAIPDAAYLNVRVQEWQPESAVFFLDLIKSKLFHQSLPYLIYMLADPSSIFFQPFTLVAIAKEVSSADYPTYRQYHIAEAPEWPDTDSFSQELVDIKRILFSKGKEKKALVDHFKSEYLHLMEADPGKATIHPGLLGVVMSLSNLSSTDIETIGKQAFLLPEKDGDPDKDLMIWLYERQCPSCINNSLRVRKNKFTNPYHLLDSAHALLENDKELNFEGIYSFLQQLFFQKTTPPGSSIENTDRLIQLHDKVYSDPKAIKAFFTTASDLEIKKHNIPSSSQITLFSYVFSKTLTESMKVTLTEESEVNLWIHLRLSELGTTKTLRDDYIRRLAEAYRLTGQKCFLEQLEALKTREKYNEAASAALAEFDG